MNVAKAKVCIVDDDPAVQDSVRALLAAFGFDPHCVSSAEEFLLGDLNGSIDGMVLDLRLPEMSGIDLLTQLTDEGTAVPTVVISGHRDEDVLAQLASFQAVIFLMKPFAPDRLVDFLSEHCTGKRNGRPDGSNRC
ncbi:Response regulator protein TodT [Stieleria neptunia]|uniref:Response regulator protein TodT n=1 Tax=Stieleria neptunia TaxID=2527979 RepID=A0A518HNL5_9BACT|nr:response regulator [Stieleria neptunia]QDV42377.1 Response regulator protein TodT [Stieleria neptunia]